MQTIREYYICGELVLNNKWNGYFYTKDYQDVEKELFGIIYIG